MQKHQVQVQYIIKFYSEVKSDVFISAFLKVSTRLVWFSGVVAEHSIVWVQWRQNTWRHRTVCEQKELEEESDFANEGCDVDTFGEVQKYTYM